MTSIRSFFAAVVLTSLAAAPVTALETRPILTLEMAKTMADACEAKAIAEGWRPVNIAIFDQGADLKYFRRMEDAFRGSIQIAMLKGQTSANFKRSTRAFGDFAYGGERPHGIQLVPGLVVFPGGLPIITAADHHIGGIGVSGATSAQDEICSQAGLDAIQDMLK